MSENVNEDTINILVALNIPNKDGSSVITPAMTGTTALFYDTETNCLACKGTGPISSVNPPASETSAGIIEIVTQS